MSYPRDLDDYEAYELRAELERREVLAARGLCTYCERSINKPVCLKLSRHRLGGGLL